MNSKPRLVFDFPNYASNRLTQVRAGKAPKEAYTCYVILEQRGWQPDRSDERWIGKTERIRSKLGIPFEIPTPALLRKWAKADIVIITARLSTTLALTAKLLGKKVIFLDALCENVPRSWVNKIARKAALNLSDKCICLSREQADLWRRTLSIKESKITAINYGIDTNFYRPADCHSDKKSEKYLICVGRDHSRDYVTLEKAIEKIKIRLVIVGLKDQVPDKLKKNANIEIRENISFNELFDLYCNADAAVIPIKKGTNYLSGIRATLEALALSKPVIVSKTVGMKEYFTGHSSVHLVEPGNPEKLSDAILEIQKTLINTTYSNNDSNAENLHYYSAENYADQIEREILELNETRIKQ